MNAPVDAGKTRNTRRRWIWAWAAVGALGVVTLAFLRPAYTRFAAPPVLEPVSLALSSTPHAALLHLAAAKGFFAEEGLAVNVVPVSHGKAALDLLSQGKVDLAAAAEVPFVIAVLKDEPLGVIASMVSVSTEMAVVARRDRSVVAPRDLVGKKIGVTFGTSGEYFLWAFLIRHKLAPESLTLVDVEPGKMAQELWRGTVDAVSAWQPIRLSAESALASKAVSFTEPDAYTVTHVVVGRSDFLKSRRGTTEKLVRAMLKAERFNRAEPGQALVFVAQRFKVEPQTLQPSWRELDFRVDLRQSQLITWEDEARWAMARGYVQPRPLPNFLTHVYLDALLNVQPERVSIAH